jgi:hypothetical protein
MTSNDWQQQTGRLDPEPCQAQHEDVEMSMKSFLALLLALAVCCCASQAADDAPLKKIVKANVEEMNNALVKEDFGKVADLTHPKIVGMMGGREKMISAMQSGIKEMKSKGYAFSSAKVEDPTDPVPSGPDLFVVVPFQMEMKAPGGKLRGRSFVIGVSNDKGKSWVYINGDVDIKKVKELLPTLPDKLKLPEKQQPVFEKD